MSFLNFRNCPRCGDKSYERMKTHSYCGHCNYSEELDVIIKHEQAVPAWALEQLAKKKERFKADDFDFTKLNPTKKENDTKNDQEDELLREAV